MRATGAKRGKTRASKSRFTINFVNLQHSGRVHTYTFIFVNVYFFVCVLASRPHVNDVNDLCKRIFSKTPTRVDKFVNVQQCTFIYCRVGNTTCKYFRHRACTHAQSRFHGNSGSQKASFYSSVMHLRLSYRLRVDRRKRFVGGLPFKVWFWCGRGLK